MLNGDVDNFADLKATEALRIPAEITTDAKVIPTLMSRHLTAGTDAVEAFRRTVDVLEGSVAIGASVSGLPGDLLLALRGSGQALYVGLAEDAFLVASEPYGLVEETAIYVRMDGETPADADQPQRHAGARSSGSGAPRPAGSRASNGSRTTAPPSRSPPPSRPPPRSRRETSTAATPRTSC